jgi:HD-like signal output (HDOD) protein
LLHDIGQLVLAANLPVDFQAAIGLARDRDIELWRAEMEVLGTDHAEIGACLLAIWGLPGPIVEAVGLHHRPVRLGETGFNPLVAVHAANVWTRAVESGPQREALPQLDLDYLAACDCADRAVMWQHCVTDQVEPVRAAVGF